MYEMYPDAWRADDRPIDPRKNAVVNGPSTRLDAGERPRRRARREHSVRPPMIARADAASPR